jgi:hypothetical protein
VAQAAIAADPVQARDRMTKWPINNKDHRSPLEARFDVTLRPRNKVGQLNPGSHDMNKSDRPAAIPRVAANFAILGTIAGAMFLVAQAATAAEWRFEPLLSAGYEYDDNAVLASSDAAKVDINGGIYEAAATVGYATARTTFDITPLLRWRQYSDDLFNSDDRFLTFDFNSEGQKSLFRIRGAYGDESTRTAERARANPGELDPGNIPDDQTGRVSSFGRRKQVRVVPQWSYNFTQKMALALSLSYVDTDYDTPVPTYVPYTDSRVSASLSRAFSERTRGYIRGSFRRYERNVDVGATLPDVDTVAVNLGFDQQLSQQTTLRAEVGVEEVRSDQSENDSAFVADISLVKNLQTVRWLAQYKRGVSGNGNGVLTPRDSINLSMSKQFSERFSGGLAARLYRTDPPTSNVVTIDQQDYAQVSGELTYALSRVFSLRADYTYTYLDRFSFSDGAAGANEVGLTFIYQPMAMRTSR